jgi:hypothetical protein
VTVPVYNSTFPCECCETGTGTVDPGDNGGLLPGCCGSEPINSTLNVTFSGGTGTCTCLNGLSVTVTYNGVDQYTVAGVSACSRTFTVRVAGQAGPPTTCTIEITNISGLGAPSSAPLSVTRCTYPFLATGTLTFGSGLCSGTTLATVTEP